MQSSSGVLRDPLTTTRTSSDSSSSSSNSRMAAGTAPAAAAQWTAACLPWTACCHWRTLLQPCAGWTLPGCLPAGCGLQQWGGGSCCPEITGEAIHLYCRDHRRGTTHVLPTSQVRHYTCTAGIASEARNLYCHRCKLHDSSQAVLARVWVWLKASQLYCLMTGQSTTAQGSQAYVSASIPGHGVIINASCTGGVRGVTGSCLRTCQAAAQQPQSVVIV